MPLFCRVFPNALLPVLRAVSSGYVWDLVQSCNSSRESCAKKARFKRSFILISFTTSDVVITALGYRSCLSLIQYSPKTTFVKMCAKNSYFPTSSPSLHLHPRHSRGIVPPLNAPQSYGTSTFHTSTHKCAVREKTNSTALQYSSKPLAKNGRLSHRTSTPTVEPPEPRTDAAPFSKKKKRLIST